MTPREFANKHLVEGSTFISFIFWFWLVTCILVMIAWVHFMFWNRGQPTPFFVWTICIFLSLSLIMVFVSLVDRHKDHHYIS